MIIRDIQNVIKSKADKETLVSLTEEGIKALINTCKEQGGNADYENNRLIILIEKARIYVRMHFMFDAENKHIISIKIDSGGNPFVKDKRLQRKIKRQIRNTAERPSELLTTAISLSILHKEN